jgi:hypothetical protein
MAVTRVDTYVSGPIVQVARFKATVDNDVLLPTGNYIVIAAYFHDVAHLSALNLAAGADISAYPATSAAQTVCATSDGTAGDVTIVYMELPTAIAGVGV